MNKQDFLLSLRKEISKLPKAQIDEHITFYSEMIDDRIEDGLSEEQATKQIGSPEQIAKQILADSPTLSNKAKKPKRRLKTWEILVSVLGSPIWISLLLSALSAVLALYVSVWCIIIALWSVFVALIGSTLGLLVGSAALIINGNVTEGLAVFGAAVVCAGLSIFMFFACKAATKGIVWLTKKTILLIKKPFVKKEEI